MNWETAGNILYICALLFCALGWGILLLRQNTGMENRMTFGGIMKVMSRRCRQVLAQRSRAAAVLKEKIHAARCRQLDLEIYDSSLLLKNLALVEYGNAFSADYIYEQLMEHAHKLKPVYAQMLTLYRNGKDEAAFHFLAEHCGSRAARNFAMVLSKVDQIHPEALVEQMEVFQEIIGQQRVTAEMKRVQRNSMITTIMAAAAVFLMVLDFAVAAVFMHTLTILENVF